MASTSTIIQPLESQVGGHAGVSTTENGSLMIKAAVPTELAFYERLQIDSNLEDLRTFTPTFLGTLKLMGKVDEAGSVSESMILESVAAAASEEKDESLVFLGFSSILIKKIFFFYKKSTIHCSRKSFIPFSQTKYSRHQARNSVIRRSSFARKSGSNAESCSRDYFFRDRHKIDRVSG